MITRGHILALVLQGIDDHMHAFAGRFWIPQLVPVPQSQHAQQGTAEGADGGPCIHEPVRVICKRQRPRRVQDTGVESPW